MNEITQNPSRIFTNMCRLCLSQIANPSQETNLFTSFDNEYHINFAEMYSKLTNIGLREEDLIMPKSMCYICKEKLLFAYKFVEQCKESDTKLKTIISQCGITDISPVDHGSLSSTIKIEKEISYGDTATNHYGGEESSFHYLDVDASQEIERADIDGEESEEIDGEEIEPLKKFARFYDEPPDNGTARMSIDYIRTHIENGQFKIVEKNGKSLAWKLFGDVVTGDGVIIHNYVACRQCRALQKYNGKQTTNLIRHKCLKVLLKTMVKTESGTEQSQPSLPPPPPQKCLVVKTPQKDLKTLTTDACLEWVIDDCRSLTSMDGVGFKKLVKYFMQIGAWYGENFNINDLLPASGVLSKKVNEMAQVEKNKLKIELKKKIADGAAISISLWPDSNTNRMYTSLTFHYVQDEYLKEIFLGIKSIDRERLTAANVLQKIKSILIGYEIFDFKKVVFVTDRDDHLVNAFKNYTRLNCSLRLFNAILEKEFFLLTEISAMSFECQNLLKQFQNENQLRVISKIMKHDSVVRWTKRLNVFNLIYTNWTRIMEYFKEKGELYRLKSVNTLLLTHIVEFLNRIEKILLKLEGSDYVSIHYVYSSINLLQNICQVRDDDLETMRSLKTNIIQSVYSEWSANLSIIHQTALFLFPPTNQLKMFNPDLITKIREYCYEEILNNTTAVQPDTEQPKQSTSANCSDDIFFCGLVNDPENTSIEQKIKNEINKYSNLLVQYRHDFDILKWWKEHRAEYPNLYNLSIKVLCIPAGCRSSEKIFTKVSSIVTDKREYVYPQTVSNVIFLNELFKK